MLEFMTFLTGAEKIIAAGLSLEPTVMQILHAAVGAVTPDQRDEARAALIAIEADNDSGHKQLQDKLAAAAKK